ncbi:class A beta-lactamase [Roseibium sp. DSM 29163]|uniref:Beta-lactamase n=1 Tax=Roseibium salinum TaxID=1604349 RepID=A0ABT3R3B5_9HYPH|nr:class A beta-lactamase [Roseibium sp. DSM 29163]MCX2723472.1 class A beta-lactamase [Roseibium sp. DSM 29163]
MKYWIRRSALAVALGLSSAFTLMPGTAGAAGFDPEPLARTVANLQESLSARIGVAVLDTQTGATWTHHADERFPLNSTFKAFLCAALLDMGEKGETDPARRVRIQEEDLVSYSPVTEKKIGTSGMTLLELCAATITLSDNTAANLVLEDIGGPAALTGFMRGIGDTITRLDRYETKLNSGIPGDERDTTTPAAAVASLHKLVLGDALSEKARGN